MPDQLPKFSIHDDELGVGKYPLYYFDENHDSVMVYGETTLCAPCATDNEGVEMYRPHVNWCEDDLQCDLCCADIPAFHEKPPCPMCGEPPHTVESTYRIVRFFSARDTPARTIQSGVTYAEARAHCNHPKNCVQDEWFDGYRKESE